MAFVDKVSVSKGQHSNNNDPREEWEKYVILFLVGVVIGLILVGLLFTSHVNHLK